MNTKIEPTPAQNSGDIAKLVLAFVVVAAGIYAFYYFDQVSAAVRGVAMLGVVVLALLLAAFTGGGRTAREFLSGSQFELRKAVGPTRQETLPTSIAGRGVVLVRGLV